MSGISPITGQFSGLAGVFQARANIPAFLRAQTAFNQASAVLASPPTSLALNKQIRALRHQSSALQTLVDRNGALDDRVSALVTGLNTINTSLTSIQTLINDTITTPGNAASNQAQINALVATVKSEVADLRALQTNPTFQFSNLDTRIGDLSLFSADGSRIDSNGITVDINVTTAATRAIAQTYVDNLQNSNQLIRFQITGPGGTSGIINLDPTGGALANVITGADRNNSETITFQVGGGNHISTGNNNSALQTITALGGSQAAITDAIINVAPTLNGGNTVITVTDSFNTPVNFTISGGTQANRVSAISAISPALNTGTHTFTITGVRNFAGATGSANITVNGGTQAAAATTITGITSNFHTNASVVIGFTGGGTTGAATAGSVTATPGTVANFTNALTGLTGTNSAFSFSITGTINSAGGTATTGTINIAMNRTAAQVATSINTALTGSGLNGFVSAAASGTTITLTHSRAGNGARITLADVSDPQNKVQAATVTGTAGISQATLIANINAQSAATGIRAAASGLTAITLSANNGTSNLFGSGSRVQTSASGGAGQIVTVAAVTNLGTAGDSQATIITNINAQNANTGIFAVANGTTAIDLVSRIGAANSFGSLTQVAVTATAGGTAATVANGTTNGTAGDTRAQVVTNFNTQFSGKITASNGTTASRVSLTTVGYGTTRANQTHTGGYAGSGNLEKIVIANSSAPANSASVGGTLSANGVNSEDAAAIIAKIVALVGTTKVTASTSGNDDVDLASTVLGLGADVNFKPLTDPIGGSQYSFSVGLGTTSTSLGTVYSQAAAIAAINAAANSVGVEAYADAVDGSDDVSLRNFLYGGAFGFTTNEISDASNRLGGNITKIGTHAVATISIDGGPAETLSATNLGNNPASGSGGTFSVGSDGVSVNQFSFDTNGVVGQFSVPVDSTFNPAAATALQDTSLFLPLEDSFGNLLTRFNFNTLNDNFIGDFVDQRANIATRGRTGGTATTVLKGGLSAINVQTSTTAATAIITQALADVARDLATADSLQTNLFSPEITSQQSRITEIASNVSTLESYNDAISTAAETAASDTIDSASTVLAQLATLFPISTGPLLR